VKLFLNVTGRLLVLAALLEYIEEHHMCPCVGVVFVMFH